MKKLLASLLYCISIASGAMAQDYAAMFDVAYTSGMPALSSKIDTTMLPSNAGARIRVDQINAIAPGVAEALNESVRNPTEDNRSKVCQLTARMNEAFAGIETLESFYMLQWAIENLRDANESVRNAVRCTNDVPSFCAQPLIRDMATKWMDANGNPSDAQMHIEANGTNSGRGHYVMSDGKVGTLHSIQCFDAGKTLKARWQNGALSGYLVFFYIDRESTQFVGAWGTDDAGYRKFQGFWNGKLGAGPIPNPGAIPTEGLYTLRSGNGGKCLDVRDHSFAAAALLQQWSCTGEPHQTFQLRKAYGDLYTLVTHNGMCVSAAGAKFDNGVPMIQWQCANGPDQLVRLVPSQNGHFTVRFSHDGKCMDVQDFSTADGKDVHQWDCSGGLDQDWKFVPANGSVNPNPPVDIAAGRNYKFSSRDSGLCLHARGFNGDNITPLEQSDCNNAASFQLREAGQGYFNLVYGNNKCISVEAVQPEDGTQFILWDCNGGADQRFRFENSNGGSRKLVFQNAQKCMAVANFAKHSGAEIKQFGCNGQANQDWVVRQ